MTRHRIRGPSVIRISDDRIRDDSIGDMLAIVIDNIGIVFAGLSRQRRL
jgi:hypothetical protein